MELFLAEQKWSDLDSFGSYSHTRIYEICGWDESILGPSPQIRRHCDVLPLEGDERYYHQDIPPFWSMI